MKAATLSGWLACLSLLACGCASQIPFKVGHDRLQEPTYKRDGSLAMKAFADTRSVTNAMQIGGKWKKAKPAYVAKQKQPVAQIVQDGFREALEKVGYRVETQNPGGLPTLEGEMFEFWLTDDWGGAICRIGVQTRLKSADGSAVLWEARLNSEEDDWAIIPNAMQAAMNTLLKRAMDEFATSVFSNAVVGKKSAK
jgi:hypothetical protein